MRHWKVLTLGIATAAIAFAARLGGDTTVAPFDELYHWKRVAYSVQHFPSVLEFDVDRGLRGAFCPWPPLYDFGLAAVALLAGARTADEVLRVIVWIPPVVTSLLIGLVIFVIPSRGDGEESGRGARLALPPPRFLALFGARNDVALILALPLATGPFLIFTSSAGHIDHHWLEPFLVVGIAGATILALRARDVRSGVFAAGALGAALTAALFVQTALIVAAAVAFVAAALLARDRPPLAASAVGFVIAAAAVSAYRLTRLATFPDSPWFLGWPHAALLGGAAVALATIAFLGSSLLARAAAVTAGATFVCAIPGAADALFGGVSFFGGDPWLTTISEFQPVWRPLGRLANYIVPLGVGAIAGSALLWRGVRRRAPGAFTIGTFTLAYTLATISSRRFAVIAMVLIAIAGAMLVDGLQRQGRRKLAVLAGIVVVFAPPAQLVAWRLGPQTEPAPHLRSFERAAALLRGRDGRAAVLAPWSYGHLFDVVGRRRVIVDNFGTMADPDTFREAHAVLLSRNAADVAAFCDRAGIRHIVLEKPQRGIIGHARVLGLPVESFAREGRLTRHSEATWYWRAFFEPQNLKAFRRIAGNDQIAIFERISAAGVTRTTTSRSTERTQHGRPQTAPPDR